MGFQLEKRQIGSHQWPTDAVFWRGAYTGTAFPQVRSPGRLVQCSQFSMEPRVSLASEGGPTRVLGGVAASPRSSTSRMSLAMPWWATVPPPSQVELGAR